MNSENNVPLLLSHGLKRLVAKDTGIGYENMHATELLYGDLYNFIAIFRRANSCYCLPLS
jgi:hypothetical protein